MINGITFDDVSFDDKYIDKLYIKYDKKLIVNIDKFSISNTNILIDANFTIDAYKNYLDLDILNFLLINNELRFSTNLQISYKNISKIDVLRQISDLEFTFDEKLPDFEAKKAFLKFDSKDKIDIYFTNPTCGDVDLNNSTMSVVSLFDENITLKLYLKSTNLFQNDLKNITQYYTTNIDISEVSSKHIHTNANIDIPFYKDGVGVDITHRAYDVTVLANDNKIKLDTLNVDFSEDILNTKAKLQKFGAKFEISNKTNFSTSKSNGTIKVKNYKYKKIVKITDDTFWYFIDYNGTIKVKIPKFGLNYDYKEQKSSLNISKIQNLTSFLPFLSYKHKGKNSYLDIKSDENLTNFDIDANNINIDINSSYFEQNNEQNNIKYPKITFTSYDSSIKYDNLYVKYDSLYFGYRNADDFFLRLDSNLSKIYVNNFDDLISIKAMNLSSDFINNIANKNIFQNGYININAYRRKSKNIKGNIKIFDVKIQNVPLVNDLFNYATLVPTTIIQPLIIPVAIRAGYNSIDSKNYNIDNGTIDFMYFDKNQTLNIDNFLLQSNIVDFKGNGQYNLKTSKINTSVDIYYFKDYATVVGHIPLIGYILLGDDRKISTNIGINGTTSDFEVQTNIIKDVFVGMYEILKRIVTLPLKLFTNDKKE